jgi:hypothetical protein
MSTDLRTTPEPRVTKLATGIVDDAQELFRQQVALLKHEIKEEIRQAKEAARSLAWGVGLAVIGCLLLCLMLPLLLNWAIPDLPLWACFGIVGAILAALGGGMIFAGRQQLEAIHPIPQQSVEALKENLQFRP